MEECTRAEIGVGAAIAAGNHLEKGSWALLVIPATIISRARIVISLSGMKTDGVHVIVENKIGILIRIITSPIRFVNTVIYPAANDFGAL